MLRRLFIYPRVFRYNSTLANNSLDTTEEDTQNQSALKQSSIQETIKANPHLANVKFEVWQNLHDLFAQYGFKTKNFIEVITEHPKLLTRESRKIQKSLEFWRGTQFGESRVENLIVKYPTLLDIISDHRILRQISALKSLVSTDKNVYIVIMNSPNILQENGATITEKFKYIRDTMRLEIPEIVKSHVFSFTIEEIKTRHIFLERLGIFKPRSLKAPPGEISKNPRLYQIMDLSESKFASKVALVSLAEFEVFKELYKRELDGGRDDFDSESEDDDLE